MTQTTHEAPSAEELPEALGARRIAGLLAERLGEPVTADDVEELVAQEVLVSSGSYKGWPLYATADALALDEALVRRLVAERVAWEAASLPLDEAAERIGWHRRDLQRMGGEGRITTGRGGRYLIEDVDRLAAEADGEQYITAAAAADVLEIRHPTDWQYVEAAGWIEPAATHVMPVGASGRRSVTVALFRLADVRAVREMPGVDWETVRGLGKGAGSPLREYAALAPTRAKSVKGFAQALADRHGVTVWAWHSPYSGGWELDWERHENGTPTMAQVKEELAAGPETAPYAGEITLCPWWGGITREARALLQPGAAVILDTETTDLDGQTVEIAVIDAATGKTLLDTLVKPEAAITPGAYWVHGITDVHVAGARPWEKILPKVLQVTKGRTICAYNADFDQSVVLADTHRTGKKPLHLASGTNWYCLMQAYADWLGSNRWLPLGGSHRAAGDCHAARQILQEIANGRGTAFTPRKPEPSATAP